MSVHRRDWEGWKVLRPWRRHSLVLLVGGLVYIGYGCVFFLPSPQARLEGFKFALLFLHHPWVCGVVWIFVGLLALLSTRWPSWSETWGYMALSSLSSIWAIVYLFSIPMGAPITGLAAVFIWGLFTFLWWGISGLVNPSHTPVADRRS